MSVTSFLFWEEWERDLLNVSVAGCEKETEVLHSKFTAVTYLVKWCFLCDRDNRVQFVALQDGTVSLVLSVKEEQTFVSREQG